MYPAILYDPLVWCISCQADGVGRPVDRKVLWATSLLGVALQDDGLYAEVGGMTVLYIAAGVETGLHSKWLGHSADYSAGCCVADAAYHQSCNASCGD